MKLSLRHELAEHVEVERGHEEQLQAHLVRLTDTRATGAFFQDQLVPLTVELVIFLDALFLAVIGHRDLTVLVMPLAMRFLDERVLLLGLVFVLVTHGQQTERIVTADARPILVDTAAVVAVEQQAGAIVIGTQLDARHPVTLHLERYRVGLQELLGIHTQAPLQDAARHRARA